MKTVFTKYSSERSPKYAIKTVILADEQGNMQVRKYPCSKEALPHVRKMLESCGKINRVYGGAGIRAAEIGPCEDGVCFEYVKGTTYEERLEAAEQEKGIGGVFELIYDFKNRLLNLSGSGEFKRSEAFDRVFGSERLPVGLHSTDFSCFDMAFGNLIEQEKGITVIDYEWCFDFPVPIEYIVYRAVKLYVMLNNKQELISKDIMGYLGFDEGLRAAFDRLEESFQSYVSAGSLNLRGLYDAFDTKSVFLDRVLEAAEEAALNESCYRVYLDLGSGFNENDSYRKAYGGGELRAEIVLTNDIKALRFDPCESCCAATGVEITADTNEGRYEPEYITNGLKKDKVIYFINEDPQIIFTDIKPNTSVVRIRCEIIKTDKHQTDALAKAFYDSFLKQQLIDRYEHDIKEHLGTVSRLDGELTEEKNKNIALKGALDLKEEHTKGLEERASALEAGKAALEAELAAKNEYIGAIERSRGWRLLCKIRKIFGR